MLLTIPELLSQVQKIITRISPEESLALLSEENSILIDVREPSEVAQQAVKGAINIPRGVLEMKMLTLYPDAAKKIVLNCATSARASLAAEQLQRIGYQNIYVINCKLETLCEYYK